MGHHGKQQRKRHGDREEKKGDSERLRGKEEHTEDMKE